MSPRRLQNAACLIVLLGLVQAVGAQSPMESALADISPSGSVVIESVRVGIGGAYRLGKWTPIQIAIVSDAAHDAKIEISTHDGEGVACTYVFEGESIRPGQSTRTRIVRLAKTSHMTVRLVSGNAVLCESKVAVEATPVSAWQQWVVVIGGDGEGVRGIDALASSYDSPEDVRGAPTNPEESKPIEGPRTIASGSANGKPARRLETDLNDALRRFRRPPLEAVVGTRIVHLSELPKASLAYDGIDLVCFPTGSLDGWSQDAVKSPSAGGATPGDGAGDGAGDAGKIADSQFRALRQWVANGGRLVISVARNAEALMGQGGPLQDCAPGPFVEFMRQRQTTGLEQLAETSQRLDSIMVDAAGRIAGVPTAKFDVQDGVIELEEGFGQERSAWLIRKAYGLGVVSVLTADIDQAPIANWAARSRLLHGLFRRTLPGRFDEVAEVRHEQLTHVGFRDLTGQLRNAMEQFRGVRLVPFPLIAGIAVGYIVLIGPLDWLFLKHFTRRMRWTWVTFPLIVGLVCALAVGLAIHWKGTEIRTNELHIVDLDVTNGSIKQTSWVHVYTPRIRKLSIDLVPEEKRLLADCKLDQVRLAWQGLPGSGFGGMSAVSRHGSFFAPFELVARQQESYDGMGIRNLSMPQWTSRSLSGVTCGHVDLGEAGELSETREGLLAGMIVNPLNVPLREAAVCFGRWYFALGTLKPHQAFSISDATPKDLRTYLTKRTILATQGPNATSSSNELLAPWRADNVNLAEIATIMMFHDAAGGRSNYTKLLHRFEANLDMSDLIQANRAVLVGNVSRRPCGIAIDGRPFHDPKGKQITFCRIVYPTPTKAKRQPNP